MTDQNQIYDLVTKQGDALESFIKSQNSRLDAIEGDVTKLAKGVRRPAIGNYSSENQEHKNAFLIWARSGRGEDELASLQTKTLSMGSDPDGGYSVPLEIDNVIDSTLRDISPIRQIARVVKVGSSDYRKLIKTTDSASGWVGETESRPVTTSPQFSAIAPPIGELYSNIAISQQLLDDSQFDLGEFIVNEVADEFAESESTAFITGDGINQPRGFLDYTTSSDDDSSRTWGQIQYVASGASGAFTSSAPEDKLIDLVHSLRPAYRQGAVWVMNSSTAAVIRKMKDSNGQFLWAQTLQPGQPSMLLGYPVYEAEGMPDIAADSLSIAFGNFERGYTIVDRIGARVLRDPYSSKPLVLFYITKRVGGSVINFQAIKLMRFSAS